MLVLSRNKSESIFIGDEIKITILEVQGNQARIGINAPKDVPVHREEIYRNIKEVGIKSIKKLAQTNEVE